MRDQQLDAVPIIEITRPLEGAVRDVRPDVVYTHHWGDLDRDHRVVSEAAMVACRPVGDAVPRSNEGVILIAATNRPDVLDPALQRPGRASLLAATAQLRPRASLRPMTY